MFPKVLSLQSFLKIFLISKTQEFEGANWDHDLSKEAEDGQLWQDDWDDDDTNDDFTLQLRQQIESTASSTAAATTAAPATR